MIALPLDIFLGPSDSDGGLTSVRVVEMILVIVCYVLQVLGLLSSPLVTLMWWMEQMNIHMFGSTARASDGRIMLYFVATLLAVILSLQRDYGTTIIPIVAWVFSHNIFGSTLMKKPFVPENERLKSKKAYADIVFDNITVKPKSADTNSMTKVSCAIQSVLLLVAVIVFVIQDHRLYSECNSRSGSRTCGALQYVPFILALIHWMISATTRFAILRVIPCKHIQGSMFHSITSKILRFAIIVILMADLSSRRYQLGMLYGYPSELFRLSPDFFDDF